jgi:hypothetical protein
LDFLQVEAVEEELLIMAYLVPQELEALEVEAQEGLQHLLHQHQVQQIREVEVEVKEVIHQVQ